MSDPRAFISFDFDNDVNFKNLFAGQAKNEKIPFNLEDWSSKESLPQSQWEKLIEDKINKCNVLIVLVGKKTHLATGVIKEIKFAHSQNIPVFGVYIDGANSQTLLPAGLQRDRTIDWDWARIASALKQIMGEGKNKAK